MRKRFHELENRLIHCLVEAQPWHSLPGEADSWVVAARCFTFPSALMWLGEIEKPKMGLLGADRGAVNGPTGRSYRHAQP